MKERIIYRILVVEDDTSLRHAIKTKLENSVYSLSEAIDGEEGIKMALEIKPDYTFVSLNAKS